MSAISIDGKALAKQVQEQLKAESSHVESLLGRKPSLAVVLVGEDPASQVYVNSKSKRARACGIEAVDVRLPTDISDQELQNHLRKLSADNALDGILLQLPLPKGLDEFSALMCIAPEKDVDGLHPVSQGMLVRVLLPFDHYTPLGVMNLICEARKQLGLPQSLNGLRATVVGRSILVGKPVALMLLEQNCTVSICHSRTLNLAAETSRSDILVAAVGIPEIIKRAHIKSGAIVIDVGINRLEDGRIVGDVDFLEAQEVAAAVTPVPGGVGPMTIAMLLANTVDSAKRKL